MRDGTYSRRECLGLVGAAVALGHAGIHADQGAASTGAQASSSKPMRGAFMILNTPFTESTRNQNSIHFLQTCGSIFFYFFGIDVMNIDLAARMNTRMGQCF